MFGVLMVPSVVSLVWFAIFGGTGLYEQAKPGVDITAQGGEEAQLFGTLQLFPGFGITSVLVMLLWRSSSSPARTRPLS